MQKKLQILRKIWKKFIKIISYNQLESIIMDFKWITIDLISLKTMEINEL